MRLSKLISVILLLSFLIASFAALGVSASADGEDSDWDSERLGVGDGKSALDGKKICFIGCSYVYYGGIVERTGQNQTSQSYRSGNNETGFFKRLCNQNGANVYVTDWVFGSHDLTDLFDGYCNAGIDSCAGRDHLADLTDREFDYVVLLDIITPNCDTEGYCNTAKGVADIFREANPDVKIYQMLYTQLYEGVHKNIQPLRNSIPLIESYGIEVIDWGALTYDVMMGNVAVPGATLEYNKNSFVVSNSASDGYHPSLLAGYLGTIMTYAKITGETTVGQPYEFIYPLTSKYLNIDKFITEHYKYDNPDTEFDESTTNMKEIFYSEADMRGLQILAEQYLNTERRKDITSYTVEFKDYAGNSISSNTYKWGDAVSAPVVTDYEDGGFKYTFAGWDKAVVESCAGDATYTAVYEQIELPPAEPDPETPAEPDPETPADPDPETPAEPDPETPVEPDPETTVEPDPDTPAEPDPETPVEPESPDAGITEPEEPEAPAGEHVCENVSGFAKFWNAIANFFRRLFGMPALCPCGKFEI